MHGQTSEAPTFKKAHFIGVGGAGMSGIALVLHQRGYQVTGSDLKMSRYTRELTKAGVDIRVGHNAAYIDEINPDVVVISTAIPETNPELKRAREKGIEVWPRAKMLSALAHGRTTIAFAGTHGKTTSSSMAATCLDRMGLDPTFLIGGLVDGYDTNGANGQGEFFVCEADESDGSFLYLDPQVVVVTNIEADHLDHYSGIEEIEETFCKFMDSVGEDGTVIVCGDSPRLVELVKSVGRPLLTYGFDPSCDVVCSMLPRKDADKPLQSCYHVTFPDGTAVDAHIDQNPGLHNVLNATSVLTACYACKLDMQEAAKALSTFSGVRRRFDYVGTVNDVVVVDDYGHHPTEIKATLEAASSLGYDHICVVFQPHRYSRTQMLADEFGTAFDRADSVIFMDVFAAGEPPIPGVNGKTLVRAVQTRRPHADVAYFPNRQELIGYLTKKVRPGTLLLTMGAGDVTSVGPSFLEAYEEYLNAHQDLRVSSAPQA